MISLYIDRVVLARQLSAIFQAWRLCENALVQIVKQVHACTLI